MKIFDIFPLLTIAVVIYAALAMTGGADGGWLASTVLNVDMPTHDSNWVMTGGDILLTVTLVLLFIEIVRATQTKTSAIINHAASMIVFIVALILFLMIEPFATSVFFLITLMTLLDVLAGFIVTIVTARRDIAVGEGFGG